MCVLPLIGGGGGGENKKVVVVVSLFFTLYCDLLGIIIWKKLLNENGQHGAQVGTLVSLQVFVLERLILSLDSIGGANGRQKAIFFECPHPSLK